METVAVMFNDHLNGTETLYLSVVLDARKPTVWSCSIPLCIVGS
jgi:hypothetical protein